jgi:CHAT domain-containing protein
VKSDLEQTLADYETFLKEIRLKNAEVGSIICALPDDPANMQDFLDDDVTVLEYYTAQDRTYAWLITKNSVHLYEIKKNGADLTAKNLQADVAGLIGGNITGKTRRPAPVITLAGDEAPTAENAKQARKAFDKKAQELYHLMVAPLEADIKTKKLVIVPHDVLHKLPFACLTDGSKALVDKYDLSIAPASSLLEFIIKKRKPDASRFLAFANPATDKISLPFAEKEVQAVESLFAAKQVFSRTDATKTRLSSLSSEFNVVHFACHGEFNDMQPLQSGLLLAQDGDDDGLLRIPDVFGLNLQKANLVTLSACETALTKVRGGEDWAGMSRGFIYAGTPSILATLWSVDDKSTSILMRSFYENWLKKGMSKPGALRQAQLDLKAMPEYSHPFYWAPFVMIGDWR